VTENTVNPSDTEHCSVLQTVGIDKQTKVESDYKSGLQETWHLDQRTGQDDELQTLTQLVTAEWQDVTKKEDTENFAFGEEAVKTAGMTTGASEAFLCWWRSSETMNTVVVDVLKLIDVGLVAVIPKKDTGTLTLSHFQPRQRQ